MRHDRETIAVIVILLWITFLVFVVGGAGK
jgi:hypothetical protein